MPKISIVTEKPQAPPDDCDCKRCKLDQVTVQPYGGRERPDVAFVIDGPTAEDFQRTSRPFNGKGGKLLRRVVTDLGMDLSNVFWTTALLCLPPPGKSSYKTQINACNARLMRELREIQPRLVMPMGALAYQAVTGVKASAGRRRGIYLESNGFRLLPTLNPEKIFSSPDGYPDFVHDIELAMSILDGEKPVIDPPYDNYILVETQQAFEVVMDRLRKAGVGSIDLETVGKYPYKEGAEILSVGVSWKRRTACIIDYQALIKGKPRNFRLLNEVLSSIDGWYHNGQFDVMWLQHFGMTPRFAGDTMLAHFCVDERQGSHGLKRLSIDRYRAPEYDQTIKPLLAARRRAEGKKVKDDEDEDDEVEIPNEDPYGDTYRIEREKREREAGKKSQTGSKRSESAEEDRKDALRITLDDWRDPEIRRKVMKYNGADADYTLRLKEDLGEEMDAEDLRKVHDRILIPAAKHFIDLELSGMKIDVPYHKAKGYEWYVEQAELEKQLRDKKRFPGAAELNFKSVPQLSAYLYDTLGLRQMCAGRYEEIPQDALLEEIVAIEDPEAQEYWKSASSAIFTDISPRSTSTYMLYYLAQQHEFPRLMVHYRLVTKKIDAYYEGWKNVGGWAPDGTFRLRPRFRLHGARTGRLSSTDPNCHGTPRKKDIKNACVADDGMILIAADYSQAEVRMMAHFAKDEGLVKAMSESDIHRATSKILFGVTEDDLLAMEADKDRKEKVGFMRRAAKTVVFGVQYGRSAKGLAPQLQVSKEEAQAFIDKLYAMMPDVRKYVTKQKADVLVNQEVTSLYGRKRRFPFPAALDGKIRAQIQRQAVNMPIQSSVSDMTLLANMDVVATLRSRGIRTMVWPHIHDGYVFQVPKEAADEAVEVTINRMHQVDFETDVPFAAEISVGERWGDCKVVYCA